MPRKKTTTLKETLAQATKKFEDFDKSVSEVAHNVINDKVRTESEPQTKLSSRELRVADHVALKPAKVIFSREKFNEKYRKEYEHDKEHVQFIAENKEIPGEVIELWTKPYAGLPAEFWQVPANKPVWGPRYLANRIDGCTYNVITLENKPYAEDLRGAYYGVAKVKERRERLSARPAGRERAGAF